MYIHHSIVMVQSGTTTPYSQSYGPLDDFFLSGLYLTKYLRYTYTSYQDLVQSLLLMVLGTIFAKLCPLKFKNTNFFQLHIERYLTQSYYLVCTSTIALSCLCLYVDMSDHLSVCPSVYALCSGCIFQGFNDKTFFLSKHLFCLTRWQHSF